MELTFECRRCGIVGRIQEIESATTLRCRACGLARDVRRETFDKGALTACALCGTEDLYILKDFPHILGLSIVVVGIVVSSAFWAYYMPIAAMSVLLLTAALDFVLYYLVPDVTICYRCLSQYRGKGANPGSRFGPFDLAVGERYRQERIRVEQLRQQQSPVPQAMPADQALLTQNRAELHGLEYVELRKLEIPAAVIALVPESLAREKNVLPLAQNNGSIKVAMSDPMDFETIDQLRFFLNSRIEVVLAPKQDIVEAIDRYYGRPSS